MDLTSHIRHRRAQLRDLEESAKANVAGAAAAVAKISAELDALQRTAPAAAKAAAAVDGETTVDQVRAELLEAQRELERVRRSEATARGELAQLGAVINGRDEQLLALRAELEAARARIGELEGRLSGLQRQPAAE